MNIRMPGGLRKHTFKKSARVTTCLRGGETRLRSRSSSQPLEEIEGRFLLFRQTGQELTSRGAGRPPRPHGLGRAQHDIYVRAQPDGLLQEIFLKKGFYSRSRHKRVRLRARSGPDLVQIWSRSGADLVPVWSETHRARHLKKLLKFKNRAPKRLNVWMCGPERLKKLLNVWRLGPKRLKKTFKRLEVWAQTFKTTFKRLDVWGQTFKNTFKRLEVWAQTLLSSSLWLFVPCTFGMGWGWVGVLVLLWFSSPKVFLNVWARSPNV